MDLNSNFSLIERSKIFFFTSVDISFFNLHFLLKMQFVFPLHSYVGEAFSHFDDLNYNLDLFYITIGDALSTPIETEMEQNDTSIQEKIQRN